MTREDPINPRSFVKIGNYKFTGKVLGKGSFATVKEAVHTDLKIKVAAKIIDLEMCNSYVLKHLQREASILKELDHPHIMRIYETMRHEQVCCLMTEIVYGVDLCSFVQKQIRKKLEETATRRLIRQISVAVEYLHSKNIVHRDLKLENIMMDMDSEIIKLVDFGLSNRCSASCLLRTLCGSPEYSAPELFVPGTRYGSEIDMWSLGVILYALATGRLPFPCVAPLIKDPNKKIQFIKTINNGLSTAHFDRIENYSPEFFVLLKGLMNPNYEKRFTIKDVFADPWFTNNNRWMRTKFRSLDMYDVMTIKRKLCHMLHITDCKLVTELQSNPLGQIAGFYNILAHEQQREKQNIGENITTIFPAKKQKTISGKHKIQNSIEESSVSNNLAMTGTDIKNNEVKRERKYFSRSIYTSSTTTSSSSKSSQKSCTSNKSGMSGGDATMPRIGPFRNSKYGTPGSESAKSRHSAIVPVVTNLKFKRKSAGLQQPVLPSKMKF